MAETEEIAKMAEIVSKEIFSKFGWEKPGPMNQNWACRVNRHTRKNSAGEDKKLDTHPSDVVFQYDDPYKNKRIFINTDLKSYQSDSIHADKLTPALKSLSMAVECSHVSDEFQKIYTNDDMPWECVGLLFVYNHDGEYDRKFDDILGTVTDSAFWVPKGRRMFIMGPTHIDYLINVIADIKSMRVENEIPMTDMQFFYPHLVQVKSNAVIHCSATLETIFGPWQAFCYKPSAHGYTQGVLIYCRDTGDSMEEFMYLIDYLFRFQLIKDDIQIKIRLPNGVPESQINFRKATESYAQKWEMFDNLRDKLRKISCEPLTTRTRYAFTPLGMGMRNV